MERLALFEPPCQVLRSADDQVHRERSRHLPANLHGLVVLVPSRHDDEDVHVAVGVRCAVGVGAEQDDLVGLESLGNLAREPPYRGHRDIPAAIQLFSSRGVSPYLDALSQ